MPTLYIDIETIPAQRPDVLEEIRATIKPPATYKKAESIAEWIRTEGPGAAEEAYRRTSLDGAFGQVAVVGLAIDDGAPLAIFENDWQDPRAEHRVLEALGHQLTDLIAPADVFSTVVVGHNVSAFDLRFLAQRSIVNGLRPHTVISRSAQAKPWESEKVFDTMVQWAGAKDRITLDKLCRALSIESPKGELDGSKVWDFVQAGRMTEVVDYCLRDIEATRRVHQRMTFATLDALAG